MATHGREFEEDPTMTGQTMGEPAPLHPDEGRKGGMVMAAPSPPLTASAPPRSFARTTSRTERGQATNWVAAMLSGLLAGTLLLALGLMLAPLLNGASIWTPVRVMASVLVGERALESPHTFEPGIAMAALVVHFVACLAFAAILAPLMRWFERGPAAVMGAAYGLLTYNLVFYAGAMLRPTLSEGRGAPSLISHLLFGIALAVLYRTFAGRPEAPIPEPPLPQSHYSELPQAG